MRVVLQRVSRAQVSIGGDVVARIDAGWLVLVGMAPHDDEAAVQWMAEKIVHLRAFADDAGKMNRSIEDVNGSVLVVSQFTLYGDCSKGRRPSFIGAASPDVAIPLYEAFLDALRSFGLPVAAGRFGADMQVELVNDGPVTLLLDSDRR